MNNFNYDGLFNSSAFAMNVINKTDENKPEISTVYALRRNAGGCIILFGGLKMKNESLGREFSISKENCEVFINTLQHLISLPQEEITSTLIGNENEKLIMHYGGNEELSIKKFVKPDSGNEECAWSILIDEMDTINRLKVQLESWADNE